MKIQYSIGYALVLVLVAWSLLDANLEFLFYAATVAIFIALLQRTQNQFLYPDCALWGVIVWVGLHIAGGLLPVGNTVLYSQMLLPLIEAPYSVLKYDQLVHAFCYFVVTLLMWRVVLSIARPDAGRRVLLFITVLASTSIGAINEIIEFIATVTLPETNVGGYENTVIDIICNLLGALLAIPFLRGNTDVDTE